MTELRIDELRPAPSDEFDAYVDLVNMTERDAYGITDLERTRDEVLAAWRDPHAGYRGVLARLGGEIVGAGDWQTRLSPGFDSGYLWVAVRPEFRRRGIGTAIEERMLEHSRRAGHARVVAWSGAPRMPGPSIPSPTGLGAVPADAPSSRFLQARGWRLEQVERVSRLDLGEPQDWAARLQAAERASGPEYELVRWQGATPAEHRDDVAVLRSRMSTDAPSAGLDEPEDVWTPERVAEEDERVSDTSVMLTVAARHRGTGRLVGFSQLRAPIERRSPLMQWDTLVLREHRGHRLGMLLKVANLERLGRDRPGHPAVLTYNAEENRPMLSVNEAVGFVPVGYEGAWRRDL